MTKTFNPHDKDQVEEKVKEADSKSLQYVEDLKWLLGNEKGRRIAWKLLSDCGVFQISFTGNSTTFFNEGKRHIGNRFMKDIMSSDPDSFLKMIKEFKGEMK